MPSFVLNILALLLTRRLVDLDLDLDLAQVELHRAGLLKPSQLRANHHRLTLAESPTLDVLLA